MCFKLEEPKNASYRADGSGDMISQRSTARQDLLVATAITRSVEQLTEQERRQLSAASLQARPTLNSGVNLQGYDENYSKCGRARANENRRRCMQLNDQDRAALRKRST